MKMMKSGLLFLSVLFFSSLLMAQTQDDRWPQVDEHVKKRLPQSAIGVLKEIEAKAKTEKRWAEAARALGYRLVMEDEIQGDHTVSKIQLLEKEIPQAPADLQPILQAIQAKWYWDYFSNNRWRFLNRTQTDEAPGEDIETWDLKRLFAEIDRRFQTALAKPEALQAVPIAQFDALLEKGTLPDAWRPTLYDFLAHQALEFYTSGEQAGARPQDAFTFAADSPALGTVSEFLAWKPQTTDEDSALLRAIRVYQDLMRFHAKDKAGDPAARVLANLERLDWARDTATGESAARDKRYAERLEAQAKEIADHELTLAIVLRQAALLREKDDSVAARNHLKAAVEKFPQGTFAPDCRNLIQDIEGKGLDLSTETVWNAAGAELEVSAKNVPKVWFRLYPQPWTLQGRNAYPNSPNRNDLLELLKKAPEQSWSADISGTEDLKWHKLGVPAPADLKTGLYLVVASAREDFTEEANRLATQTIWASSLSLVTRTGGGALEGRVLDAISGEPKAGAEVSLWSMVRNQNAWQKTATLTTDKEGGFQHPVPGPRAEGFIVHVKSGTDEIASRDSLHAYPQINRGDQENVRTFFFTDRAIYRPGQIVRFKGILIKTHPAQKVYTTMAKVSRTVALRDPNGEEVARADLTTNENGSFSGSFTLPRGRGTGGFTIADASGQTSIQVEEYKRPKFLVTLDDPAQAPKLGEIVQVSGKAEAYTGAAVDGAEVTWRVTREPRWPSWLRWAWWFQPPASGEQEIANGTSQSGVDGRFAIEFTALPDLSIEEKADPWFIYRVSADVTDTTGETRSGAAQVTAGYTALKADLTASDWQVAAEPVKITVSTGSLGGAPEKAKGQVAIHRLKMPEKVHRTASVNADSYRPRRSAPGEPDLSDPNSWELDEVVQRDNFSTDEKGIATLEAKLAPGEYRAVLETKDRFGKAVTAQLPIRVVDPAAAAFPVRVPFHLASASWSLEPGQEFTALWGTGYPAGSAQVEIEHRGKILKSWRTAAGRTQEEIRFPVTEDQRGGFTVHVTYVRENRAYLVSRSVSVPWTNKNLTLRWETLRSKIEPGSKEKWSLVVTGDKGAFATAEMAATLYDASLDAFLPHSWPGGFGVFPGDYSNRRAAFHNDWQTLQIFGKGWDGEREPTRHDWRRFPYLLDGMPGSRGGRNTRMLMSKSAAPGVGAVPEAMPAPMMAAAPANGDAADSFAETAAAAPGQGAPATPAPSIDLGQVTARTNLNETAFFHPQLLTDAEGRVTMEFTMPEALTTWRFLGFAHDGELRGGLLQGETVTAKDIMVQPNPPRFLREDDTVEFTVKISNQTDQPQQGKVRLSLAHTESLESADAALGNKTPEKDFSVPARESRTYAWRLTVPDGQGFLTYKAVAGTGKTSDGEEGFLPVLPRRILVTESMTLPIRDAGEKDFSLAKLLDSAKSKTLRHESLTVQVVSQPAWYAVLALPYLMEYPYECSEQVFNRLYANAMARHLAGSDPKIRRVFDVWRDQQPEALDSPLLKNEDLKAVMIEETPWLRDAKRESEGRRNIGILFDGNRLDAETTRALESLEKAQLDSGGWPWFPGGRENDFITLYVVTGFGRLGHLGVPVDDRLALRALDRLDAWITERHQQNLTHKVETFGSTEALYLYGRGFFLERRPISKENRPAVDYFLNLAKTKWTGLSRISQAHTALGTNRFGDKETPPAILKSLTERSVTNEEMGRFWRDTERSWWWYHAPIESQAMMIEAYREIGNDAKAVEDCQVWLLKQKQTQAWPTTKSTADAVYGLLLGGENLLASDARLTVSLGGEEVKPEKVEAGTGFYEQKLPGATVKPAMGQVKLTKTDAGVSWGSLHWQYFEDMAKVTPHEGNPLTLKKTLHVKVNTKSGPQLRLVKAGQALKPGDELVTRVELKVDRDMEFVHLKDQRGSGTEPVNVLSGYRFQDGLAYYESTRDTASHFFIDYLPKGTYVFETSARVQLKGRYQSGIAEIQCLYAPEFNSHSGSVTLEVK